MPPGSEDDDASHGHGNNVDELEDVDLGASVGPGQTADVADEPDEGDLGYSLAPDNLLAEEASVSESRADDITSRLRRAELENTARSALSGAPQDVDVEEDGDIGASQDPVIATQASPRTSVEESARPATPSSIRSLASSRPASPPAMMSPRTLLSPRQVPTSPSHSYPAPGSMSPSLPTTTGFRTTPIDVGAEQAAVAPEENKESGDNSRFESIPLQTTPPRSAAPPLPSSPHLDTLKDGKGGRRSWNGLGLAKHRDTPAHGSTPQLTSPSTEPPSTLPPISTVPNGEAIPVPSSDDRPPTPARRHAPPAHPHPFPVPSSPSIPPPKPTSPPPGTSGSSGSSQTQTANSFALGKSGVSAFEKVVSHTRPSHLPPKPREEDDTHYHQWEEMMATSREHEAAARKVREARRLEKEKRLWVAAPRWEEMLKDPQGVENAKTDPELRTMWFEGCPSHLRGQVWARAIGNPLAMRKDAYRSYLSRAKKAMEQDRFPKETLRRIDEDLDLTFPPLGLFQRGRAMREDLREFLLCWLVYRSDDGLGYASCIALLGAMFLLVSPPPIAFVSLCNLLARPCLRAFYSETRDEIDAYYRVFENLEADAFPKIYANCKNLGLKVPEGWFRSILTEQIPFEAVCRLWDQIMLEGDSYIFRSCLGIVNFLEPRLHFPDREEIASVLEGRNRATIAITEREKERARLKGETVQEELDGKMSVFGLTEEALFEWLERDQWKESRFERLVLREMPD